MNRRIFSSCTVLLLTCAVGVPAVAGPLRDRLEQRREARREAAGAARGALPFGVTLHRDLPYGTAPAQRMDVYAPAGVQGAPVLLLVHGGGWRHGDKAQAALVEHKVAHWTRKGYVVVSVNYRMLPEADPLQQAHDVARALAEAQRRAGSWGGDADRFVLMGHSAGAHLVALLAADPALPRSEGARPWRGTVALDSAAYDVVETMEGRHPKLYDEAFGRERSDWEAASPAHRLLASRAQPQPMLLVCSSGRQLPCPQAEAHARRLAARGGQVQVLPQQLTHREINQQLGLPGDYTAQVERFIDALVR